VTEVEAMDQIRRRMAEYATQPETYVPTDARAFCHLNLAFYDRSQQALGAQGFALIGDYEIAELKGKSADPRCFLRMMAARDGTVTAAIYHPKPSLWFRLLLRLTGKPLAPTLELETEFSDDSFIANVTPPLLLLDPPPLLVRQFHPAGTPVEKLLALHLTQIRGYLTANPGVTIRRVTDFTSLRAAQQRQHAIKGVYRQMVGGMSADELRRLGGFTRERAAKLKRLMDGETPAQVEASPASLPPFPAHAAAEDAKVAWWKRDLSERAIGGVLLACGLGLGYLGFYLPWRQAVEDAPEVSLSYKAAVISVMLVGTAPFRLFAPQWTARVLGPSQQPNKLGYAALVGLALVGLAVVGWFKGYLATLGYKF
jgi:hypothetical protein